MADTEATIDAEKTILALVAENAELRATIARIRELRAVPLKFAVGRVIGATGVNAGDCSVGKLMEVALNVIGRVVDGEEIWDINAPVASKPHGEIP